MSDFIILHNNKDGKVYINKNQISDFARTNEGEYTRVFLGGEANNFYTVKESPEEIYNMIRTTDCLKGETLSVAEGFVVVTSLGSGLRRAVCLSEIFTIEEKPDGCRLWYKADKSMGLDVKETFPEVCSRAGIVVPVKTEKGDERVIEVKDEKDALKKAALFGVSIPEGTDVRAFFVKDDNEGNNV